MGVSFIEGLCGGSPISQCLQRLPFKRPLGEDVWFYLVGQGDSVSRLVMGTTGASQSMVYAVLGLYGESHADHQVQ